MSSCPSCSMAVTYVKLQPERIYECSICNNMKYPICVIQPCGHTDICEQCLIKWGVCSVNTITVSFYCKLCSVSYKKTLMGSIFDQSINLSKVLVCPHNNEHDELFEININ